MFRAGEQGLHGRKLQFQGTYSAFAAKNNPVASFFDGLGMGLGFTIALTLLGAVREFLGTGKIFNLTILPEE